MMQRDDIRPVTVEDVKWVTKIEHECFFDPWSERLFLEALNASNVEIYIAETEESVVGFLVLSIGYDDVNVDNIAVSHAYRRRGIARKLLTFAHEKYKNRAFLLEVRESNEPAINLYKSLGYEPVGFRKRYYHNPEEGAVLMTRQFAENAYQL